MPSRSFAALTLATALAFGARDAAAARPKPRVQLLSHPEKYPAMRYGSMAPRDCKAELQRRGVAFTDVRSAPGVLAPVRLPSDVGGVIYRTATSPDVRATNPFDVFDCRLVLALSDFSKVLLAHDIDEVLIFSAWRPVGKSLPTGSLPKRHPGALAIDAYGFAKKRASGESERVWLNVEKDFHGSVGLTPCGVGAAPPQPYSQQAAELHSLACEAADQHFFNSILTPDYNRAHFNHFHMEVTPAVNWFLVR